MPALPVVSAGSLLEFVLADHHFSMPVGRVRYLHMGPMTFTEFLQASGETELHAAITAYELGTDIGPIVHGRLLEKLRQYYFIGGMPAAIDGFIRNGTLQAAREAHDDIIDTYRDDFPKYAGARDLTRLLKVFNFAARNVGRKIKYTQISQDDHSSALRKDIELLNMARVITKVVHSHSSGLPLQADIEEKVYKLLFLDVGLMNGIAGLNWNTLGEMNDQRLINEGTIAEQFVGQHLQALLARGVNRELTYWTRESKSSNAEVDFVIGLDGQIVPIEVKAGAKGSLRSLHQFVGEKKATLAVRFDANLPSVQTVETVIQKAGRPVEVEYRLVSLPLYLVERLFELKLTRTAA
jgi:predicted AAA+ superfamily ATPase